MFPVNKIMTEKVEEKRLDRNTPVNKGVIKLNAIQLIDALQSMIDRGEIKEEAKVLLNL